MQTPSVDKSSRRRDSSVGRLKRRIARILVRSSCTTNATSATAAGSGTAFVSLTNTDSSHPEPEAPPSPYFCTPCTYERPKVGGDTRPRRRRSASPIHISVDCTGGAGAGAASGRRSDAPLLQHLSVPPRDVVTKQCKGRRRSRGKPVARSPSASRRHYSSSSLSSWGRARRPSSTLTRCSWSSSSSTGTGDELAPFGGSDEEGGDEAETRTLFSSDSTSEFYHTNGGGGRSSRRSHSHRNLSRRSRRAPRRALPRTGDPAPAPPDAYFRPLVSVDTKKHRECNERNNKEEKGLSVKNLMTMGAAAEEAPGAPGMAVAKRSSNPYLDFRSSMVEMVVERRIGSVGKMEELLGSYLSLNSPRHHPAILAAFEDVWEAVFREE